ncbi:MAG: 2-hydroxyhepta-2,4-diene-1,7-dioate isomerase, partial [Mucilaginibacter sp.]
MKLYNTIKGILLEHDEDAFIIDEPWDTLVNRDKLEKYLSTKTKTAKQLTAAEKAQWLTDEVILPPISRQEVWAAGVTYLKSRDARIEESQGSGAASLYDMVYDA